MSPHFERCYKVLAIFYGPGEFTPYFWFLPSHFNFAVVVLDWALIFSGSEFSKHVVRDATGGWRVETVPQRRRSAPDAREGAGDARLQRNREIPSGFRRELGQRPAPRRPWPVVEPAHDALPGKMISATERWSQATQFKGEQTKDHWSAWINDSSSGERYPLSFFSATPFSRV